VTSLSALIRCYDYGHFVPEAVSSGLEDHGDLDVRVLDTPLQKKIGG
jgi:hypothetical protein